MRGRAWLYSVPYQLTTHPYLTVPSRTFSHPTARLQPCSYNVSYNRGNRGAGEQGNKQVLLRVRLTISKTYLTYLPPGSLGTTTVTTTVTTTTVTAAATRKYTKVPPHSLTFPSLGLQHAYTYRVLSLRH